LCVGALAKCLKISEAAVSQHLQVLRKAGFVQGEKRGYWTHYAVQTDRLVQIADDLKKIAARKPVTEGVCFRTSPKLKQQRGKVVIQMCKDCCQRPEKTHSIQKKILR
jgi:ArsR family transcriptional regulator